MNEYETYSIFGRTGIFALGLESAFKTWADYAVLSKEYGYGLFKYQYLKINSNIKFFHLTKGVYVVDIKSPTGVVRSQVFLYRVFSMNGINHCQFVAAFRMIGPYKTLFEGGRLKFMDNKKNIMDIDLSLICENV